MTTLNRSMRASKTVTAATAKQRMLKMLVCSDAPEQALRYHGYCRIAGVDEVGRGALFGPVVAAAVILPECMDELAAAGLKRTSAFTSSASPSIAAQNASTRAPDSSRCNARSRLPT